MDPTAPTCIPAHKDVTRDGSSHEPARILIVRLGAFGDVVRTLPAAWALRRRHPGAHLGWLVEPAAAPLLRRLPWLDEVIEFPRPRFASALSRGRWGTLLHEARSMRRSLRAFGADCVLDFHGILKSGVLSQWTGARRRVGFARPHAREGAWLLATEHAPLPAGAWPRWQRNAALAAHLGAQVDDEPVPGLRSPGAGAGVGVGVEEPSRGGAVLHPGTSPGTPHKRYPLEAWLVVARELAATLGQPCRVTTGPDPSERAQAAALVERAGPAALLVDSGHDLGLLIETLASARLFVGSDTGPLHLASLLGTPVVQILGPTHPVQNEPWSGTPWARAHLPLPCSPCRKGCAEASCLALLPASDVVAAARRLLLDASASVAPNQAAKLENHERPAASAGPPSPTPGSVTSTVSAASVGGARP